MGTKVVGKLNAEGQLTGEYVDITDRRKRILGREFSSKEAFDRAYAEQVSRLPANRRYNRLAICEDIGLSLEVYG